MTNDFAASMRRATAAVRAADPAEAMRIIQNALNGNAASAENPSAEPVDITPPRNGRTALKLIDRNAEIVAPEKAAPQQADTLKARTAEDVASAPRSQSRMRKPLGEVLNVLRDLKLKTGQMPGLRLPGTPPLATPPIPAGARFVTRSFSCAAGARDYRLYIPASAPEAPRGLIVMLHGCQQNPDDFAAGTGMNAVAETHGLLVAYPAQTAADNQMSCWNWFNPANQMRGTGEPSIIAGITREIAAEHALARNQIFVAGLSAGGAMAAVLAETYPDLYAAAGIHSGLATGSADDVVSAFAAMRGEAGTGGSRRANGAASHLTRTIVFHGTGDKTVHPSNALRLVADSGGSASPERTHGTSRGGRTYMRSVYAGDDGAALTEYWSIDGAGHAWSGGHPAGSYTDHTGPDASAEMVRFFLEGVRG